jgi:hypothetical protein
MTSRIDQPTTLPGPTRQARKAEDTDTRQALQRHDPEFYKKKDDKEDAPGFKDPYEDLADVSVPALKNFLLGLLDKIGGPQTPASPPQGSGEAPRTAASPQAAAAVSAYQAGARRGVAAPPPLPPAVPPTAPVVESPATALDQAAANLDRAEVLALIRELDQLYAQGITAIALEKGDGFLASIRAGIDRARNA